MRMKTPIKLITFTLLLMIAATSCRKKHTDEDEFRYCVDDTDYDVYIDWSKIDLNNIERLHEQPLPVIQKCIEGKWKFINIPGVTFPNDDDYIIITRERIIMSYNISGIFYWGCKVDSPIIWRRSQNFPDSPVRYYIIYNHVPDFDCSIVINDHNFMMPTKIKNDTLTLWNMTTSNRSYYYLTKVF